MGVTYTKAPAHYKSLVKDVLHKYYPDLEQQKLRVDMLLAHAHVNDNGESPRPALMNKGVRALAQISICKLKDRAFGRGDCEILIDGDACKNWKPCTLEALIDHELQHLEWMGETDDLGRPKLKMRPHDVEFGWFDAIARRHGSASFEVQQAEKLFSVPAWRQLYLPGIESTIGMQDPLLPMPSITAHKAAEILSNKYGDDVYPSSLSYVSVPHTPEPTAERPADLFGPDEDEVDLAEAAMQGEDGEPKTMIVEAWVDKRDRAVVFKEGKVLDVTNRLQLSLRWSKEKS